MLHVLSESALLVAHSGGGASWQALVTVMSVGTAVLMLLAAAGRVPIDRPDDLVLPLATVAILSALAPMAQDFLSDQVGWAIPVGVAGIVGVLVFAFVRLEARQRRSLGAILAALGFLGAMVFSTPLKTSLHPVTISAVLPDDVEIEIISPELNGVVDAEGFTVVLEITGGSVGPEGLGAGVSSDPEELAQVLLFVDNIAVPVTFLTECTIEAPCTRVEASITTSPGRHNLNVELRPSGGFFASAVFDSVVFVAE